MDQNQNSMRSLRSLAANSDPQFLVRTAGGYAIQFHMRGFSIVPDDQATPFDSPFAAEEKIHFTPLLAEHKPVIKPVNPEAKIVPDLCERARLAQLRKRQRGL